MNDSDRRRYEMLLAVQQFGVDNTADFPAATVGGAQFGALTILLNNIETISGEQQAGFGEAAQQYEVKGTFRENLRELMSSISRTAKSMEYSFDGISDKFRFQRNLPDADLLAKARAFDSESQMYEADFVAYGLDPTFRVTLEALATEFEGSFGATASAKAEHVEATAQVADLIRQGMIHVRILDGIVKNRYDDNPGKTAAWTSASHVERPPKKTVTPPTPA